MTFLRSLALAFSSFSAIPMPQVEWREGNMKYLMACFPFVGLAVALVIAAWTWISGALDFGPVLFGAGIALVPVAVTGGIHLDGFCDVVDAQSSHASPERKREIMKDPHAGAFASIATAAYLVMYTALAAELAPHWQVAALLGGMHVASRCLSSIATLAFPGSSHQGMLSTFREAGGRPVLVAVLVELAACAAAMLFVDPLLGGVMLAAGLVCLLLLYPFAKTQFGGMSGDLAGFFLQVAELCMVAALVIAIKVVSL
ncbi:MAG: adenosylcobinamide-GDP ribazoletransferase [Coriobacteriaceae bacterium]|nr:adenosylcobinamide-GDP ribazoletransferase [Coriobacteriaceae bacterium]